MKRLNTKRIESVESASIDEDSERIRSWRDEANCSDADMEQMFGDPQEIGKDTVRRQQKLARIALCGECEVEFECLEAAKKEEKLGTDSEIGVYGVRGGMTESERRRYYKRLRRGKNKKHRKTIVA